MREPIYNDAHVAFCHLLGRTYNNPLGETAFGLLKRLLPTAVPLAILDAGCGRGQTATWWADRTVATIDAFDPSTAMLAEARRIAEVTKSMGRIRFHESDISGFSGPVRYDLVLAHDVLCYSRDRAGDTARLADQLVKGGILSVTDYWCDEPCSEVNDVLSAWGIQLPPAFDMAPRGLNDLGLTTLLHLDTTAEYRRHWTQIRDRLHDRHEEARALLGGDSLATFNRQIGSILTAVQRGGFGHCWSILQR
jgi:SAM-dependent methyltransferase